MTGRGKGRPPVKVGAKVTIWLLVELLRDRQTRKRADVRPAVRKLNEMLPKWFTNAGHMVKFEGLREHHKAIEREVKAGTPAGRKALEMLATARARRELWGWDTSAWLLIADAQELREQGYNVVLSYPQG
jgi:hypothetical protein